jgi:hypothetical protein
MINLFEHFKTTVHSEFDFLKNFGFTNFEEEQIAYEYHIISKSNNNITIDFQIEMISSTPIWITINGINIEKIFESHSIFKNDKIERENLYKGNFDQFLKSDNSEYLLNNQGIFHEKGFLFNENYLRQIKLLLLENQHFLHDVSLYVNLQNKITDQNKIELKQYYLPFKKLFENDKLLIDEEYLKKQLITHLMVLETDKVSLEINSYDAFKEFLTSFSELKIHAENVIYKFEPK